MDATATSLAASAGAIITDEHGHVLMVNPLHTAYWNLPGGHMEGGEDPSAACAREIRAELGLDVTMGDLLVVAWVDSGGRMPRVYYVFDGGEVDAAQRRAICSGEDGPVRYRFTPPDLIDGSLIPAFAIPMWEAALTARKEERLVCLEVEM
ncbi:NUDIX hydrolase [Streptomyces longispororuber]|uniref:NUDIX domain-containing protein n=1 Tax=Streptomyces TaxID=1883 RepID=UPI0024A90AE8|nr:NUDIX hydrolase [Streptomyces sp. CC224B]